MGPVSRCLIVSCILKVSAQPDKEVIIRESCRLKMKNNGSNENMIQCLKMDNLVLQVYLSNKIKQKLRSGRRVKNEPLDMKVVVDKPTVINPYFNGDTFHNTVAPEGCS